MELGGENVRIDLSVAVTPLGHGGTMKSILNNSFRYTPSSQTDLRKTFARLRREQRHAALAQVQVIVSGANAPPAKQSRIGESTQAWQGARRDKSPSRDARKVPVIKDDGSLEFPI